MRTITWNILADEWVEPHYYPALVEQKYIDRNNRIKIIVRILIETNADLILLQEVMEDEYETLIELFSCKYFASPLSQISWSYGTGQSGNVSFLKNTMFTNINHCVIDFGLMTTCNYNENKCIIYNIHLDDISTETRTEQFKQISTDEDDAKYIIAGDFNESYPHMMYGLLPSDFSINNLEPTYNIEGIDETIDNILTKGFMCCDINVPKLPITVDEILSSFGSDHLYVIAELN